VTAQAAGLVDLVETDLVSILDTATGHVSSESREKPFQLARAAIRGTPSQPTKGLKYGGAFVPAKKTADVSGAVEFVGFAKHLGPLRAAESRRP
jgi:hypothetical protein